MGLIRLCIYSLICVNSSGDLHFATHLTISFGWVMFVKCIVWDALLYLNLVLVLCFLILLFDWLLAYCVFALFCVVVITFLLG